MPKYDATKLLYKYSESDRFINELNVPDSLVKKMKAARTLARNKIKTAFTRAKSDERILTYLN